MTFTHTHTHTRISLILVLNYDAYVLLCNSYLDIPKDCQWNDWNIGTCSHACGGGTRTNTRTKIIEASNGGVCDGESTSQEACNTQKCPGKFTTLTQYKTCLLMIGLMFQTYNIILFLRVTLFTFSNTL